MGTVAAIVRGLKVVVDRVVDPLRADESIEQFTLSIPEAQTTTVDSVQGRSMRPPAIVRCDGCDSAAIQHSAMDRVDCPGCWRTFGTSEADDLELLAMLCPRCGSEMDYGIRHPGVFDSPEWATCPDCQYHWDLDHWF